MTNSLSGGSDLPKVPSYPTIQKGILSFTTDKKKAAKIEDLHKFIQQSSGKDLPVKELKQYVMNKMNKGNTLTKILHKIFPGLAKKSEFKKAKLQEVLKDLQSDLKPSKKIHWNRDAKVTMYDPATPGVSKTTHTVKAIFDDRYKEDRDTTPEEGRYTDEEYDLSNKVGGSIRDPAKDSHSKQLDDLKINREGSSDISINMWVDEVSHLIKNEVRKFVSRDDEDDYQLEEAFVLIDGLLLDIANDFHRDDGDPKKIAQEKGDISKALVERFEAHNKDITQEWDQIDRNDLSAKSIFRGSGAFDEDLVTFYTDIIKKMEL